MNVEGQLIDAQLELSDNSQVAETKGRITYNTECESPVIDKGDKLERIQTQSNDPAGVVKMWPTEVIPEGFFLCNGQTVDRVLYADLFAAIGTRYGTGDGSTTFSVPDYRGMFIRGADNGAGQDPDRNSRTNRGDGTVGDVVGTKQGHQFASHTHTYSDRYLFGSGAKGDQDDNWDRVPQDITRTTAARGGNETRPENVTINFIIKAK